MSAATTGSSSTPGGWTWPEDLPREEDSHTESTARRRRATEQDQRRRRSSAGEYQSASTSSSRRQRQWRPRQCRICLETVLPTYHMPSESLPGFLQGRPYVTYDSEEGGRLIRPCKCKGSSRFVHDTCLQEWRHADPAYGRRNFFECPTCHFKYRLGRMTWSRWLSSKAMQLTLTILILAATVFLLGFIADPIINLYLGPVDHIVTFLDPETGAFEEMYVVDNEPVSWIVHFSKGLASLGLLGALKTTFGFSQWGGFRIFGGGRGRRNSARERFGGLTALIIIAGIGTFIWTVYKAVRAWSRRFLERASERVLDVQGDEPNDDDDDDNDDEDNNTADHSNGSQPRASQ